MKAYQILVIVLSVIFFKQIFWAQEKISPYGKSTHSLETDKIVKKYLLEKYLLGDNLNLHPELAAAIKPSEFMIDQAAHTVACGGKYVFISTGRVVEVLDMSIEGPEKVTYRINHNGYSIVSNIIITPDGRFVITIAGDVATVTDMLKEGEDKTIYSIVEFNRIYNVLITPDGRFIVAGTANSVRVVDLQKEDADKTRFIIRPAQLKAISENGRFVVVANGHEIDIIDMQKEGEEKNVYTISGKYLIAITPDGRYIAAGPRDTSKIQVLDMNKKDINKVIWTFKGSGLNNLFNNLQQIYITPDGKYITCWYRVGKSFSIDIETGREYIFNDAIYGPIQTPNGRYVLTIDYENTINLTSLQKEGVDKTIYRHKNESILWRAAISNDAKYIVLQESNNILTPRGNRYVKIIDFTVPQIIKDLSLLQLQLINWLYTQQSQNKALYNNANLPIILTTEQQIEIFDSLPSIIQKNLNESYNIQISLDIELKNLIEWLNTQDISHKVKLNKEQMKVFKSAHRDVQKYLIQTFNLDIKPWYKFF